MIVGGQLGWVGFCAHQHGSNGTQSPPLFGKAYIHPMDITNKNDTRTFFIAANILLFLLSAFVALH